MFMDLMLRYVPIPLQRMKEKAKGDKQEKVWKKERKTERKKERKSLTTW